MPILALMDLDPHGISILSTYKYGSTALAHQNANLAIPAMAWLGVKMRDFEKVDGRQGLLPLTARDRGLAMRMLERNIFREDVELEWRRALQTMLVTNVKAEIQLLHDVHDGLENWLDERLGDALREARPGRSKQFSSS